MTDFELNRFLIAILLLLAAAHLCGYLFQRIGLPRVVGEIAGGIILGPSGLGHVFPSAFQGIFNAFGAEAQVLSMMYWLGLILLMFISGFEIERLDVREDRRLILAMLAGSTIIPFACGWLAWEVYDFSPALGSQHNTLALRIVIAVAVAVTSIPVLSKIFMDLDIIRSRFAKVVLSCATIHDVILWVAVAVATGLVQEKNISASALAWKVLSTLLFFAAMIAVMPRIMGFFSRSRFNLLARSSVVGYTLFVCFMFAAFAGLLKINIVFGAFLAGITLGLTADKDSQERKKPIREMAMGFFVPIYFALVGFKLDLIHHFDGGMLAGFTFFAMAAAIAATFMAAYAVVRRVLPAFNLAMAMNARGGPGIVLATVAFELGIISEPFFVTLIILSLVSSLLAGVWFRFCLTRGWQLL